MAKKSQAPEVESVPAAAQPTAQSYQGLARKYRPQNFEQLVGQEEVARSFSNALRDSKVAHGHILAGPRGVGKTTSARILAKALNCDTGPTPAPCGKCRHCVDIAAGNDMDVIEIDAASNTQVEKIRELLERVVLAPFSSRHKVYIIDEVHMLSTAAFNALLKTLEEPPAHVIFILATTELEKIPETVRSRCQPHNFRRLTQEDIIRRLTEVAAGEGLSLGDGAREVYALIAQAAEGGMRDALVAFDQLLAMTGGKPDAEAAARLLGLASQSTLADTIGWLAEGDAQKLLSLIADLVSRGRSLERFVKGLMGYLHDVMLLQARAPEEMATATGEALVRARALAERLAPAQVFNMLNQFFELEERMKRSTQTRFLVEFAFLRMAVIKPVLPIEEIVDRLKSMPAGGGASPSASSASEAGTSRAAQSAPLRSEEFSESEGVADSALPAAAFAAAAPPPVSNPSPSHSPYPSPPAPSFASRPASFSPRPAMAFSDSAPAAAASPATAPGPPPAPAASFGSGPLAGLSREELIESIVPQLAPASQFLARYLKGSVAMRADGASLWIQWPKGDTMLAPTLARPENRKAIEQALEQLCGRPMAIKSEASTMESAPPPPAGALAPRRTAPLRASFADSAPDEPMISPAEDFEPSAADLRAAFEGGGSSEAPPRAKPAAKADDGPAILSEAAAKGLFESSPDLAKRAKMARDFFSGTFVDGAGRPLAI